MPEDLQSQIDVLKKEVDRLSRLGSRPSVLENFIGMPFLRALWTFGIVKANWDATDLSGHGLTLTAPASGFGLTNTPTLWPFVTLSSSAGYYYRAHENELLLQTYNTVGAWFYINANIATPQNILGKWVTTGNQRSYVLWVGGSGSGNTPEYGISSTGANLVQVGGAQGAPGVTPGVWHFLVGRMINGSELALFYDGNKYTNTTSIPTSIYANTSANFEIGRHDGAANWLSGGVTLAFLSNWALTDDNINYLWNMSRWIFGR